jgi:hypothetical protein
MEHESTRVRQAIEAGRFQMMRADDGITAMMRKRTRSSPGLFARRPMIVPPTNARRGYRIIAPRGSVVTGSSAILVPGATPHAYCS